ncbi:hypothetical protein C2G38_2168853 [Gigaspora rosea]|uniref:Uncharacterized protein n=1 Tax=Gigaspora rosea TaxID=44941 RepID=A0A397VZ70_9GLOM|nr:hypothetical protein C2G38_2168853 [Gigaspora rosea]
MAYVKCKIHEKGYEPYMVKALIDILSVENIIRKSLVDKLGIKYSNPPKYFKKKMKDALGIVDDTAYESLSSSSSGSDSDSSSYKVIVVKAKKRDCL